MENLRICVKTDADTVTVEGGRNWPGMTYSIPGDFTYAAFLITACLMVPGSTLEIREVNLNRTRTGFLDVLERMGAHVKVIRQNTVCNEPVGDIRAVYTDELKAVHISRGEISRMAAEVPFIALLSAKACGRSIIECVDLQRTGEFNFTHAISTQLQNMGLQVEEQYDSLVIIGSNIQPKGVFVKGFENPLISMMLAAASLHCRSAVTITEIQCLEALFPDFWDVLEEVIER
jgi:3-phosphoshikimate 1-carboxyvinyltransferase